MLCNFGQSAVIADRRECGPILGGFADLGAGRGSYLYEAVGLDRTAKNHHPHSLVVQLGLSDAVLTGGESWELRSSEPLAYTVEMRT
jgi:hypothetical protein